ncbi:hypothetical protein LguiB_032032 [Lonicera macranthoides]
MRISVLIPIFIVTILTICCVSIVPTNVQCLEDQRSLLLQLKNTFKFNSSLSTKLVQWNHSKDCCLWEGITCSKAGYVIGLDLNSESISGGIDNSSSLFSLQFLESLNLANNDFNFAQIPSAFIYLTSLTYLNLSDSYFGGQIPIELSQLTRLVTLDLSTPDSRIHSLKLKNLNLNVFIQNLTQLTHLYLDGVKISAQGYEWCRAVSSSLPKLRTLSLSNCNLSGPIHPSLAKLQFLSVIRLDENDLTGPVPEFIANFKNLTTLSLSSCNLVGVFPQKIFQVQTLKNLNLSNNGLLHGSLPDFPKDQSLQSLVLKNTNFSGALPYSVGNLRMLSKMDLAFCNFSGPVPNSIGKLTQLAYLDFSSNTFSGPIPSSLFAVPSLQVLILTSNHFDGPLPEISGASSSLLDTLELDGNRLDGTIPSSFFDLKRLNILSLSFNNLSGTIQPENFHKLVNLITLDLSYNSLSIETNGNNYSLPTFPQLTTLKLASCKLRNFPDLKNQSTLFYLDLSENQIGGEIPNWIWHVGSGSLSYLNLSRNLLENLQEPYVIPPRLKFLDLSSNQLQGQLPIPPQTVSYIDYSSNFFSSSIPVDIGYNLTFTDLFSIANNNLTGSIPISICNARYLKVLDLSNNNLSGSIPMCLIEWSDETLGVLNLGKNQLSGKISGVFQKNCGLQTLNLCENLLEGKVPESLANCTMLKVLNLGNNRINDTFPCLLSNFSNLHVLVLRSNMFHGGIYCPGVNQSWPNLQIIDIASNYFTGHLVPKQFLNWKAMMDVAGDLKTKENHLGFKVPQYDELYCLDTVTIINKGQQMELVKILNIFTSIDFSNNYFEGDIPETVGELKSLYVLNLSHNSLTGSIPPLFGNLKELESLDLSANKLVGQIPPELASITFLSALNLSYNKLTGKIPIGNQFQTFAETSFEGNEGLCGLQLNKSCSDITQIVPTFKDKHSHPKDGNKWEFLSAAAVGYVAGLVFVIGPLFFCERWSKWYWKHVDHVVLWIVNQKG